MFGLKACPLWGLGLCLGCMSSPCVLLSSSYYDMYRMIRSQEERDRKKEMAYSAKLMWSRKNKSNGCIKICINSNFSAHCNLAPLLLQLIYIIKMGDSYYGYPPHATSDREQHGYQVTARSKRHFP